MKITNIKGGGGGSNFANRSLFIGDNVEVLDNLNSACVDLIYLDPPFNSNKTWSAPIGSAAAGASFKDAWTLDDVDEAWVGQIHEKHPRLAFIIKAVGELGGPGDEAYLIFMARRLLEMHRILKPTGSFFLHCDQTMSHSLKLVADAVFGSGNFRNEISWLYGKMNAASRNFPQNRDAIFFYSKSDRYIFNVLKGGESEYKTRYLKFVRDNKVFYGDVKHKKDKMVLNRVAAFEKKHGGISDDSVLWDFGVEFKRMDNNWQIPIMRGNDKERTGYPTQKPLALLERIIKATTNEGDMVLDPFCGCATAMVAAERLGRKWIGIDISDKAIELIRIRLQAEENLWRQVGRGKNLNVFYKPPMRTDNGDRMVNPKDYKHVLYGQQKGYCALCEHHFPFHGLTMDHIRPISRGGQGTDDNFQLLCASCNSSKGDRSMEEAIADLKNRDLKGRASSQK